MLTATALVHRVHRRILIHRRGLAAVCAAVLVWATITAVRPAQPPGATVWTAARDLPSGTVITSENLKESTVPIGSTPHAAHDLGSLTGRTLAGPLGAGEIASTTQVMGPSNLAGHPGRSAVPLRIPDAEAVALLRVGDHVDLVASDFQQASDLQQSGHGSLVAEDAVVLALPQPSSNRASGVLEGRLVVFAIPTNDAADVATNASGRFLNLIWNR